jgi:hypothetical protein
MNLINKYFNKYFQYFTEFANIENQPYLTFSEHPVIPAVYYICFKEKSFRNLDSGTWNLERGTTKIYNFQN